MTNINLLPGWAMAAQTLHPLRDALLQRLPGSEVESHTLPAIQLSSMEPDLAALAERLSPGVLVGWSFGGMLAVQLQRRFPERFSAVVTIASNACFVARTDWPQAMPSDTFKSFYADMRTDPEKALKRFALLVTQSSTQRRHLGKALQWDSADSQQRLHALAVLGVLDNRVTLSRGASPVLHCLAANDALVPAAAAEPMSHLAGTTGSPAWVKVHSNASHALPLEHPLWLADQIAAFLEAGDV
jgi:pimeloyl-[acyl-carrier protein] methyl ester esterase